MSAPMPPEPMSDERIAEIRAEYAAFGGPTELEELLAEVHRLRDREALVEDQVRIVRRVGEEEAARAAYEAMDAERRNAESRRAVDNVAFADLRRELDAARAELAEERARHGELVAEMQRARRAAEDARAEAERHAVELEDARTDRKTAEMQRDDYRKAHKASVAGADRLAKQVEKVSNWATSDVVTARSEFGNGYREAMRDVRDLLNGGEAATS